MENNENTKYVALDTLHRGDQFVLEMNGTSSGPFIMVRHSFDDCGVTTIECWRSDETRSTRNLRRIVMVLDGTVGFIV